jgi:L-alanine-DL-glutamate epimerase-like enolase superfamily enzyme
MRIRASRLDLRLSRPFTIARGTVTKASTVLVEIESDGRIGLGEAAPISRYGVSHEGVLEFFDGYRPGCDDPLRIEELLLGVPEAARCGLDIALYDLLGQRAGLPLWQLFGLDSAKAAATSVTLGIEPAIEAIVARATALREFPTIKVKLGTGKEIETLEAVRGVYNGAIRIDANEGWNAEQSVELLREMERFDLELCEQPIPAGHPEQLRYIRERVSIPIVTDEDSLVAGDLPRLYGCVDGANLKLAKSGGIRGGLAFIHTARAMGLKVMIGCMVESSILATAAAHLAPLVDWLDIDGPLFLEHDPYEGIRYQNGAIELPTTPGLGVRKRAS